MTFPRGWAERRVFRRLAWLLEGVVWSATVAAVALWGWLVAANDAGPAGMLAGFAPRWWLVAPWAVLVPLAFVAGRRSGLVALAGAVVTLFGVAQFEVPRRWSTPWGMAPPRGDVRVITYNTDGSVLLAGRLRSALAEWRADVILLQDCHPAVFDSLRAAQVTARRHGPYCLASRWPVIDVTDATRLAAPRETRLRPHQYAVRLRVRTPFGVLPVYAVHFPSPREALSAVDWPPPDRLGALLRGSLGDRGAVSAAVSSIVSRRDPHFIVAGDFNMPYGSALLRRDWGDLTNAFAHAGWGFGHTMRVGPYAVRIDHVLVPPVFAPVQARVLGGYPSEHQPVVVDLVWRDVAGPVSATRSTAASR